MIEERSGLRRELLAKEEAYGDRRARDERHGALKHDSGVVAGGHSAEQPTQRDEQREAPGRP
jgi:hypothetical protein